MQKYFIHLFALFCSQALSLLTSGLRTSPDIRNFLYKHVSFFCLAHGLHKFNMSSIKSTIAHKFHFILILKLYHFSFFIDKIMRSHARGPGGSHVNRPVLFQASFHVEWLHVLPYTCLLMVL